MELERGQRLEYGCPLRRVCCQADGLAYASTMGWMQVEPQQRNAHPSEEDRSGSMNLPTSVEERVNHTQTSCYLGLGDARHLLYQSNNGLATRPRAIRNRLPDLRNRTSASSPLSTIE